MPDKMQVQLRVKSGAYLDQKTIRGIGKIGARGILNWLGGQIVSVAKDLTGVSGAVSAQPGQPPRKHVGTLWDAIAYALFPVADNETIGDYIIAGASGLNSGFDRYVPGLLEKGGTAIRRRRGKNGKLYVAHYRPHPYMVPSLDRVEALGGSRMTLINAQLATGLYDPYGTLPQSPSIHSSFLGLSDGPFGVIE